MRKRSNELGVATVGLLVFAFAAATIEQPQAGADPLVTIDSPVSPLIPKESLPGPEKPDPSRPDDSGEVKPPLETVAPESPATTEPVDVNSFVQLIEVYHDNGADSGSAVHIGDGVYLTCRHVFTDDYGRPWKVRFVRIAGRRVECEPPTLHPTLDVASVRTKRSELPVAEVIATRPVAGDPLTVVGVKTDTHKGQVSRQNWRPSMGIESPTMTESGDSGAGVFDMAGRLVGIQNGSTRGTIFFTPLSDVESWLSSAPAEAGAHTPSASPAADTSVCECLGYRGREHCACLQNGVKCQCNATKGSEWFNENGRPVRKTGRYLDPRQKDPEVAAAPQASPDGTVPEKRADGQWWWNDGTRDYCTTYQPVEGLEFNGPHGAFVFTGGKMVPKGSQMAVEIKQPTGHWETRCYGSYCKRVWVLDN